MFTRAAGREVVNDDAQLGKRCRGIGPDVRPVGFPGTRREHRHRRFVGMYYVVLEHDVAQGIDQRLQLYAALQKRCCAG